jgi:putative oxidoreductase
MDESRMKNLESGLLVMARVVLGLVFLSASFYKITDPGAFARAVTNYRLVPGDWVNLFAATLPWVEAACGILLLSGQWVRTASLILTCLLLVFELAVGLSLARGLDIGCGCFSPGSGRQIGWRLLGEDALYLVLSLFLLIRSGDRSGWRAFLGLQPKSTTVTPSPPS